MGWGGEVIYAKRAQERALIASTTKIMTALLAIENGGLDDEVTARPEFCAVEGSTMYLVPGERYTVRELLQGLLLASGNDAALALAEHTAGSVDAFVLRMNEKVRRLGLRDTHFANPHGLDAEGHYSTAEDLARLMACCMQNACFAELVRLKGSTVHGLTYANHNKLLLLCEGCLGGKTGYTEAAGRCLVSCCERDGTRLICVTLDDPQDWTDHQRLYDWAFAAYEERDVTEGLDCRVPVIAGNADLVRITSEPQRVLLRKDAVIRVEAELPRFTFAPLHAGERAGVVRIFADEALACEAKLIYGESVDETRRARFSWRM
ncbi:MAG: D-alanyl-D-alanine carboxypeptidase [Oscillospiraceae bacterium]|nr:D-alanyl-D-alanine carboxypeptidase [Oscillospiraceae bacterium]